MSEVKRIQRYSRDFKGNMSKDPMGPWVLSAEAWQAEYSLTNKLDAQRLRADTAEAELKLTNGLLSESNKSWSEWRAKAAAAEQRIAELSANNQQLRKLLEQTLAALNPSAKLSKSIRAALKPNPEAESHG